jgi:hypothetical protein
MPDDLESPAVRDLVLQARLAMVRGSLQSVERVLKDLEEKRSPVAVAGVANDQDLGAAIEEAVPELHLARLHNDMSAVGSVANRLEEVLKAWQSRGTAQSGASTARVVFASTRVDDDVREETNDRIQDLQSIHEQVTRATSDADLAVVWRRYAGWSAACLKVFRDYVDLVRGVLMRDAGLDNELCRVADALVRDSGQWKDFEWKSLTIPASEDHGDVSSLRLIRMGFPEWSVWALPLTMYEIGHLFAEINRKVPPIVREQSDLAETMESVRLANDEMSDEQREASIKAARDQTAKRCEIWIADAYATARLGPAYVWATMLLRADPGSDVDDRRVAVMLEMLDLVMRTHGDRPGRAEFAAERDEIREQWCAARVQVSGVSEMAPPEDAIQKLTKAVWSLITVAFGPAEWAESLQITNALEARRDIVGHEKDDDAATARLAAARLTDIVEPIVKERSVLHLRHVLSGAWKARLRLADEPFDPPPDDAGIGMVEARDDYTKDRQRKADELARRTREVCIALIDKLVPQAPSPASVVTGTVGARVEEAGVVKTRFLPLPDQRSG